MLNLLISIITMAQDDYTQNQTQTTYRERAIMVRQKGFSILSKFFANNSNDSVAKKESEQNCEFLYVIYQGETGAALQTDVE